MSETERQAGAAGPTPRGSLPRLLRHIPLAARMFFYGAFFLTVILVLLPYVAHRVGLHLISWQVDLDWFRIVGVVIFLVFLAIYVRSSYLLSRRGRGAYVEFDPPSEFVTAGPFRWMRNPIAACVVGMLLGEALALSSVGVMFLFLLSLPLAHLQVVLLEEPLLERRFGQAYADYCARVPRWIPRRPPRDAP